MTSPNNPHFGLMMWLGQPYAQRHSLPSAGLAVERVAAAWRVPRSAYLADDLYLFGRTASWSTLPFSSAGDRALACGLRRAN